METASLFLFLLLVVLLLPSLILDSISLSFISPLPAHYSLSFSSSPSTIKAFLLIIFIPLSSTSSPSHRASHSLPPLLLHTVHELCTFPSIASVPLSAYTFLAISHRFPPSPLSHVTLSPLPPLFFLLLFSGSTASDYVSASSPPSPPCSYCSCFFFGVCVCVCVCFNLSKSEECYDRKMS